MNLDPRITRPGASALVVFALLCEPAFAAEPQSAAPPSDARPDVPAESAAEAARVLDLVAARDASWLPIQLDYSLWTVPGRAAAADAIEDASRAVRERGGMLWWDGRALRTHFELFDGERRLNETSIDYAPGTCTTVVRNLAEVRSTAWPALRTIDTRPSVYLDAVGPVEYGFGHVNQSWSRVRKVSSRLQVRGRETVLSRDCVRIGLEYGGATSSGKSVPLDLWVDDRDSMLVLRKETYSPAHMLDEQDYLTPQDIEHLSFERDGITVVPTHRWEVIELAERDGRSVPRVGRSSGFGSLLPNECRLVVVDPGSVAFTAPAPALDLSLPAGGGHFDDIRGEHYTVASGEARLTTEQGRYWSVLERLGQTSIRSGDVLDAASLDFANSTCGANAALLECHLNGRWCSLDALHADAQLEPRPGGDNDLAEVQRMLEAQGLTARAVETDLDALESWGGFVIAHTLASEPHAEPGTSARSRHFLVARALREGDARVVEFVSPPHGLSHATAEDFATIWTGRALLVSTDPTAIDSFIGRHASARWRQAAACVGVGIGALLLAWVWLSRRSAQNGALHGARV